MERSLSGPPAPIRLSNSDYNIPKNGVGLTGHPKKVLLGNFSKDMNDMMSRLGQIERQARKVPGPGMYLGHTEWTLNKGSAFSKSDRGFKSSHANPAPNHYENKEIGTKNSNAAADNLSQCRRTKFGRLSKGKKRNFLDNISELAALQPAPGKYHTPNLVLRNKLEVNIGAPNFQIKISDIRKTTPKPDIGPDHYKLPEIRQTEEQYPVYSVPRSKGNNFVDKVVRTKMLDSKTPFVGPGKYDLVDLQRVSRGTKQITVGGLGKSCCSGFF